MPGKTMHGARAVVSIFNQQLGTVSPIGIWTNVSLQISHDVQPSFVLGRYTAAELTTTAVEPVMVTASGWRVIDHGFFNDGHLTKVSDLLTQEYLVISITDRKDPSRPIHVIRDCLPTGASTSFSIRQLSEITVTFMGIISDDESLPVNAEAPGAVNLP